MPDAPPPRLRWLFVDMNSFFASAEQHADENLRGRPVAIVPIDSDFTCFIAASVEAKRLGVGTGMPVREARRRFPSLVILKARPAYYVELHKRVLAAADKHAPKDKVYSIDEWSVRLAPAEQPVDAAVRLARRIKGQIAADLSPALRCSVGIAPTRLLAKIACDLRKPDGLVALATDDLPGRLDGLDLHDLPGIGPNMAKRLDRHGIKTPADLWQVDRREARRIWGSVEGDRWWYGFHGVDVPEVVTHRGSMGHSNVLDPKFRDESGAHGILIRLLCKLGMRLRFHGYFAHHLCSWVRHECGRTWVDQIALPCVQDTATLVTQFEKIWTKRQRMLTALRRATAVGPPKKVAIDVLGLVPAATVPAPLFAELDRPLRLYRAIDALNQKFGRHAVYPAGMHGYQAHAMDDKIAFGRLPDENVTI